jgi:glycine/D-amino acid oxidase-like deaminating enzyme
VRRVVPERSDFRIAQTRVADWPILVYGFPSVGAAPGYYKAVSHSGIALRPVIGRILGSEILCRTKDQMLADFRPERFP